MALKETLERRLENYIAAETRILTEGESVEDEDRRKLNEANLKQVRAGIESIQQQLNLLTNKVRKRKQYAVRMG